ncbi:MAG TPA: hypothetical protein VMW72_16900 [Sedimentisphaerales bacterium]|nr:hypothetical protein [Sedimentisphaerales bacterium]
MFDPGQLAQPERQPLLLRRVPEQAGRAVVDFFKEMRSQISFTGELFVKLLSTLFHPGSLRWKDTFLVAEKSGAILLQGKMWLV